MRVIIPSQTPTSASFARSTTATYIDENGFLNYSAINQPRYQDGQLLLEEAAINLLPYSSDFANAAWTKSSSTVTANTAVAPDGTTTADTLNTTGASGGVFIYVAVTPSTQYTFSWYAKRTADAAVGYRIWNETAFTNLLPATSYYDSINASTWVRVQVTFTTPAGCTLIRVYPCAHVTGGVHGVYAWGAQMEVGASASSYIPTTSSTVPRGADSLTGQYMASYAATTVSLPIQLIDEDSTANLWVSGATYAVGDLVYRLGNHRVYSRLVAGAGTTVPEADPTNWRDIRSTTRWAPLVLTEDTELPNIGNMYFSVTLSGVQALYLGGVTASTVRIVVVSALGVVRHDESINVPGAFAAWSSNAQQSVFFDLTNKSYDGDRIDITLIGATPSGSSLAVAGLRYLAAGLSHELGETMQGPRLGINDYSRKETDEFGTTTFVQRGYSKRLAVDVMVPTAELQRVFQILAELRANMALWVPSLSPDLAPLTFFGWCREFGITVAYARHSLCAMEIEGVV